MYKFFKRNNKAMLAVFMVFLMIAFIIPTTFNRFQDRGEPLAGMIGKEKILRRDVDAAEHGWHFLAQTVQFSQTDRFRRQQWFPIVDILTFPLPNEQYENARERTHGQMRRAPELYYLLQLEARKMGLAPNFEEAREFLNQPNVAVLLPNGARVPFQDLTDDQLKARIMHFLPELLMVSSAFMRAAQADKISQPLALFELASGYQEIKTYVVDFAAKDFEDKVAPPTPEQLQQHFDRFGEFEPGAAATDKNPFGFGYKYPNRVKVQYIGVPRAQVRQAVRATKQDYDWDVEAARYYNRHQGEFVDVPPATTQSSLLGPTEAKAPTTKPFEEVREQVLSSLIEPLAEKLHRQIVSEISAKLNADFEAYQPTTATSAPASTQSSFQSFEYLQEIARGIETRYKVTLTVASIADSFKTSKELRLLPGIGQVPSFPDYATIAAEPFVPADQRKQPGVMPLFKASKPSQDEAQNTYLFRITAAEPAHKPASVDEVKEQVAFDYKRLGAFELAKAEAQKLYESARTSGLESAAKSQNLKVILTGAFSKMPMDSVGNFNLSSAAQTIFKNKAFALLGELNKPNGPKPVALIELPPDMKVAVAELVAVELRLPTDDIDGLRSALVQELARQSRQTLAYRWFDLYEVMDRLGYVDATGKHDRQRTQQAAE